MKISRIESGKASSGDRSDESRILPKESWKNTLSSRSDSSRKLSPLEQGMASAEQALVDVPDVREDIVADLKERIQKGEYKVSGEDIAEMMLRRRAADRIR